MLYFKGGKIFIVFGDNFIWSDYIVINKGQKNKSDPELTEFKDPELHWAGFETEQRTETVWTFEE